MKETKVYIEVTNTISLGFTSGIQRVTQRILQEVKSNPNLHLKFIPIYYCRISSRYLHLTQRQNHKLYNLSPKSKWFRINRMLYDYLLCRFNQNNVHFEADSILLELESNWNNFSEREKLYKRIKSNKGQVIFFCHDIIPLTNPELIRDTTTERFKKYIQKISPYIDKIITSSNFNKNELLNHSSFNVKQENISVVKLGADIKTIESNLRKKSTIEGKYLLMVGTLEIRKNHILVLKAFEELQVIYPDLTLIIIGKIGWKIESTFNKLKELKENGLKIKHYTNVPDSLLQQYYKNAFFTIVPSITEGFGLPIVEALKFGCPVICSNIEVFKEVGGVFPDYFQLGNAKELKNIISKYIDDENAYTSKKKELSNYIAYNWQDSANDFYKSLIDTHYLKNDH